MLNWRSFSQRTTFFSKIITTFDLFRSNIGCEYNDSNEGLFVNQRDYISRVLKIVLTCVKVFLMDNSFKKGAFGPNSKRHCDNNARQSFISVAIHQSYRVSYTMQALSNKSHAHTTSRCSSFDWLKHGAILYPKAESLILPINNYSLKSR